MNEGSRYHQLRKQLVGPLTLAVLFHAPAMVLGQDQVPQRRAEVTELSAAELRQLLAKQQRFDALEEHQKVRLRQFHQTLTKQPDAEQLRGVMHRYVEWLGTLTSRERATVQDPQLSIDERLERIATLYRKQGSQTLAKAGLTATDADAILNWFNTSIEANEDVLTQMFSAERPADGLRPSRRSNQSEPQAKHHQRMRLRFMAFQHLDRVLNALPTSSLVDQLSPGARDKFLAHPQQTKLLKSWIRSSFHSKFLLPPGKDVLFRWMRKLPADEQAELEKLPPNELEAELRQLYMMRRRPPRGMMRGRGDRERHERSPSDGRRRDRNPPPP